MKLSDLTIQDLQNIYIAVGTARVDGVQAAAALVVLHNKVGLIIQGIQAEKDGNGNGAESDKPGADQLAPAANHVDSGN